MANKWKSKCGSIQLYLADCREQLGAIGDYDAIVTDPPYGATSLDWDVRCSEWLSHVRSDVIWCFGSFRYWLASSPSFESLGWKLAQEIVWEKQNGSSFQADRFKRVHELAVQWYRGKWRDIYKDVQKTYDAKARSVVRNKQPPHTGSIAAGTYTSQEGGPRLMRSVLKVRSCHRSAIHKTQKPLGIVLPLVAYSVPRGGLVVDPFMGSGTTGIAAIHHGCKFIGIENDPQHFEAAKQRIINELTA